VLLLGLEAPEKDLAHSFALAHNCRVVKGFAVGRRIFAEPAVDWFAGRIDDREAIERMAAAFARLSDRWREGERKTREAATGRRAEDIND
jgi:5-dehydro-2-deoxygluconokinase